MELIIKPLGSLQANCYIIFDEDTRETAVIDPGYSGEKVVDLIKEKGLKLKYILLTHGHGDHIGGITGILSEIEAPVLIHPEDAEMLSDSELNFTKMIRYPEVKMEQTMDLTEASDLAIGNEKITIIHTPGHTKGGVCILAGEKLFSGDTLFNGSIGRTDFPGGSFESLRESIQKKLFLLGDSTVVYPGHGGPTTIKKEKETNPFVGIRS